MRARPAVAGLLCVAALTVTPGVARANGDPASDILLSEDSYLPYYHKPTRTFSFALRSVLRRAHAAHYPLKVAVIGGPEDLGIERQFFGKPQAYADFLAGEIAFRAKGPLLVVMPNGFGTHNAGRGARDAVKDIKPSGPDGNPLLRAAIDASVKLANAAGHPVAKPNLPGDASGGGSSVVIVLVLVALVGLAGSLYALKQRSAASPARPDPE